MDRTALVLRALHLGDLLVAVPALRALRCGLPQHRIVLATDGLLAPLVAWSGAVDELLPTLDPAALRWPGPPPDVVVNLHGAGPQSHRALDALRPERRIGIAHPGLAHPGWRGPRWADVAACCAHERARWCAVLAHHGMPGDPADLRLARPPGHRVHPAPVLVHPGARYGSKRWPVDRFGAVAAALDAPDRPVLVTGSVAEEALAWQVTDAAALPSGRALAGCTDLGELARLVAGAALVVSGDTGIAHLAAAFGTPSVTLFGPVGPARWGPPADGPHLTLGRGDGEGEPFAGDPDPALLAVGVPDVLVAADRALIAGQRRPARASRASTLRSGTVVGDSRW